MHYKTFSQHLKNIKHLIQTDNKPAAVDYLDHVIQTLDTREQNNRKEAQNLREAPH